MIYLFLLANDTIENLILKSHRFNESIKKDRISTSNCFVEMDGEKSEIFQTYRLHKGFKNYLLDENGVIIAKDINAKQLSSYLN